LDCGFTDELAMFLNPTHGPGHGCMGRYFGVKNADCKQSVFMNSRTDLVFCFATLQFKVLALFLVNCKQLQMEAFVSPRRGIDGIQAPFSFLIYSKLDFCGKY
jgi:hypothetical protein